MCVYLYYIYYIHTLRIVYNIFYVSVIAEELRLSNASPSDTSSMISSLSVVDIIKINIIDLKTNFRISKIHTKNYRFPNLYSMPKRYKFIIPRFIISRFIIPPNFSIKLLARTVTSILDKSKYKVVNLDFLQLLTPFG